MKIKTLGITVTLLALVLILAGCSVEFKANPQKMGKMAEEDSYDVDAYTETDELTHIVTKGESLWSIADLEYGDALQWRRIYEANMDILDSPDALKLGQVLIIPQD